MARIYASITELIGKPSLVRLGPVKDTQATIVAKLEFFHSTILFAEDEPQQPALARAV